jgi:hypothetical protein
MTKHSYLVYRNEKCSVGAAILVKAVTNKSIANDEELVDAIRDAVTKLARQGLLRSTWEYAGTDMNIGDVAEYASEIAKAAPGIFSLSFESVMIPNHWNYDTSLCDDIEEDAYESSS